MPIWVMPDIDVFANRPTIEVITQHNRLQAAPAMIEQSTGVIASVQS